MSQTYEGMFLLDNQAVRADWSRAKGAVTELLAKYGAKLLTARRWDERKLAYPVKGRTRGTYLLAYFEGQGDAVNSMRRELDLHETVLRYLLLAVEGLPAGELELAQKEEGADFAIPAPPPDESLTPEQLVFGEFADRPVHERSRPSHRERNEGEEQASEEAETAEASDEEDTVTAAAEER